MVIKARVVLGESLIIRHEVRNPTARVVKVAFDYWGQRVKSRYREVGGPWKTINDWLQDDPVWGKVKWGDFKPGQSFEKMGIGPLSELVKPGQYEMQLLLGYSHSWLTSETKLPEGAWTGILECTPARIEVVEPTGVDAEAFAAFGPYSLYSDRRKLVERFPTSIYAGYVLTLTIGSVGHTAFEKATDREGLRESLKEAPPSARPYIEKRAERIEHEAAFMLSAIETFLAAHPDFVLRARLQVNRAALLAYFERYDEAWKVAKAALPEEEYPIWKQDGQRVLDLLAKRAGVKPE